MRRGRGCCFYPRSAVWMAALTLTLLSACASTPPITALSAHSADLPTAIELIDVPFFPQEENWCGPAALATVLQHAGVAAIPEQLASEVYLPERKGSLQMELLAAGRTRERVPYVLEPELGAVLREVAAGHPVLVLQNLGFDWLPRWHYAVVVGFDLAQNTVILRSGSESRRRTALTVFDRTWSRGERWATVVLKPHVLPVTADSDRFIRAAHDLEATGKLQAAFQAYTAASTAWPEHFVTQFALGNAAYRLGELPVAETALRRAAQAQPAAAPAWNNLAYVLAARGCGDEARAAAQCAAKLAPNDPGVADTQSALATTQNASAVDCQPVLCASSAAPDSSPAAAVSSE